MTQLRAVAIGRMPRGIRNHNPGNIERNHIKWDGMAPDQSGDVRFCVFDAPEWGIRAMAKVLLTYHRHRRAGDGSAIDTVDEVIDRWAPSCENDSDAYAAQVRRALDVERAEEIDIDDAAVLAALVSAIIAHENGRQPYAVEVIKAGVAMALK